MTLRLNGSTSGYVEIDAPATAGSNTLVLPNGNGTNGQYLQTNGSGSLSWAGAGKILQVVSTNKSDTFSTAIGTAYTDITGLSVSITPTSASSKILVFFNVVGNSGDRAYVKLLRGSTDLAIGDAAGSRIRCTFNDFYDSGDSNKVHNASAFYLDSPATTTSTTYKLQARCASGGSVFYVNRSRNDSDDAGSGRGHSSITVMEVAA